MDRLLILIHPSASADASAVKSSDFFKYIGQIWLESSINKVSVTILTFGRDALFD